MGYFKSLLIEIQGALDEFTQEEFYEWVKGGQNPKIEAAIKTTRISIEEVKAHPHLYKEWEE